MRTDDKHIQIPDFMIVLKRIVDGNDKISQIHNDLKMTSSHLYSIKKTLEEKGLISVNGEQRTQKISPTEKGEELVANVNRIMEILNIDSSKANEFVRQRRHKYNKESASIVTEDSSENVNEFIAEEFGGTDDE